MSRRRSSVFDPVLHVADVTFSGLRVPDTARVMSTPSGRIMSP